MSESLAEKIKKRRQQAGISRPPSKTEDSKKQTSDLPLNERIDKLVETLKLRNYDHLAIAEELHGILSKNITQSDLSKKIGMTQGWISQKLALLAAPAELQEKMKRGELSATSYYKSAADRGKKLIITRKLAIEIARAFRDIGIKYGLAIELSRKPTNKEILTAFARAKAVKGAVVKA